MFKKMIAWMLLITVTATVAVGGTLAYLTDRDSEANVFTTGDVNIDLNEDFKQGTELIPGITVTKKPTITNDGPNDAWVWATVAVPAGLESVIEFDASGNGWEAWMKDTTTIDNKDYVLYTVLHTDALEVGDVTEVLFTEVTLNETVDIDPDGNWHTVSGGTATDLNWKNSDGNPVIYVSAYAIQKDGFATCNDAYKAYNEQWAENGTEYEVPAELVDTAEELIAALEAGTPVVIAADITVEDVVNIEKIAKIDLNGYKLTVSVLEAKADTEISNGTLIHGKSTYPALSVSNGTLTLDNVDVVCENYCSLTPNGNNTQFAAEYVAIQVWGGACVLNNSDITVRTDEARYSNTVIAIGINGGEFTMNGGTITVDSHGSTRPQFNYESVVFASGNTEKVVNLNNVNFVIGPKTGLMYAWGGNTTVNTTEEVGSWDGLVATAYGGTYTVNYID